MLIFLSVITIINLVGLVLLSRHVAKLGDATAEFSVVVSNVIKSIKEQLNERL